MLFTLPPARLVQRKGRQKKTGTINNVMQSDTVALAQTFLHCDVYIIVYIRA